jgi:alpha-L-rhamnosidase
MLKEFVFERARFAAAHASTVADTSEGPVVAWFGGSREGSTDVAIWLARKRDGRWNEPIQVADGMVAGGRRHPCWNPVLLPLPDGRLLLFYKVGPSPSRWWGMLMTSDNHGASWSPPQRLPEGILGPIKNKPVLVEGRLLSPSSCERDRWRIHVEESPDLGRSWSRGPALNDGRAFAAIQPTILTHADGSLQILCRTRQGAIATCRSTDGGQNWSPLVATHLPNPDSGIDAATLADGRSLLVYNHAQVARSPLNLVISEDGEDWHAVAVLEDEAGEYSYPALIQGRDDKIHITYTWNRRRICYVQLLPLELAAVPFEGRQWPGKCA